MSIFIQMISSKLRNVLLPNLVSWCIIMRWSVMWKDWFSFFKVKVTAKAHGNMTVSTILSELLILFLPNFLLIVHYHKPECLTKKLDSVYWIKAFKIKVTLDRVYWIKAFKIKVTLDIQNVNVIQWCVCSKPSNILLPNLVLWWCHELECHAERLVCYFQGQGHSKGWYGQNMTVYYIFRTADPLLPNFVW